VWSSISILFLIFKYKLKNNCVNELKWIEMELYKANWKRTLRSHSFSNFQILLFSQSKNFHKFSADFSQNEGQLSDQFESISNDLQKLNFLVRSSSLLLSNSGIKSFNASARTTADIYGAYHNQQPTSEEASLKTKLTVFSMQLNHWSFGNLKFLCQFS